MEMTIEEYLAFERHLLEQAELDESKNINRTDYMTMYKEGLQRASANKRRMRDEESD
jgi:hypothetical protein